jgi:hypothetical protein
MKPTGAEKQRQNKGETRREKMKGNKKPNRRREKGNKKLKHKKKVIKDVIFGQTQNKNQK